MPNHIRSIVKPSKDYAKIKEAIVSKREPKEGKEPEEFVDFQKIIPAPENIEKGNCGGKHENGVVCWYEWNVENWGTKWNSYEFDPYAHHAEEFSFQTAWRLPEPIIKKISQMFPDVEFDVKYADEDIGSNLGWFKMQNGEITWEHEWTGQVSIEDEKRYFALQLRDKEY